MGSAKFTTHDGSGVDVGVGFTIGLGVMLGIIVGVEVGGGWVLVAVD